MDDIASIDVPLDVRNALDWLASGERNLQGDAFALLEQATAQSVAWADAAWPTVVPLLRHRDNRVRSIAGQILCQLAASASRGTVLNDLDALIAVTHDERFVTARHVLTSLWRIGLVDVEVRHRLLEKLAHRCRSAIEEKNAALIRYDILCCLRRLFDETGDEAVKPEASALIADEPDHRNAKKMRTAWRGA